VLEKVGDSPVLARFIHRSDAEGDIRRESRRFVPLDHQQFETVFKGVLPDLLVQRLGESVREEEEGDRQGGGKPPERQMEHLSELLIVYRSNVGARMLPTQKSRRMAERKNPSLKAAVFRGEGMSS